jgi:hypothetical protein
MNGELHSHIETVRLGLADRARLPYTARLHHALLEDLMEMADRHFTPLPGTHRPPSGLMTGTDPKAVTGLAPAGSRCLVTAGAPLIVVHRARCWTRLLPGCAEQGSPEAPPTMQPPTQPGPGAPGRS